MSRRAWLVGTLLFLLGCNAPREDLRPDILLVVLDTVRSDAVSSLGGPAGATPHLDTLAREGLLYSNAFASAPWTLPSHASLFTGLRLDQHGVGIRGRVTADASLVTLAERLRDVGYQTVGLSENPLISDLFNMSQGFERFSAARAGNDAGAAALDLVRTVASWTRSRDVDRPFFLFVNVFDAHLPYRIRGENPHLPPGATIAEARAVRQSPFRICDRLPSPRELAIMEGLYRGDVRAADAKLGAVLDVLRRARLTERLVTVVVSDHGEHFGEKRLLVHQFSVGHLLLHIPLVVHGLPDLAPAEIPQPVDLTDVAPSILEWAGAPVPPELSGRALPTRPDTPVPERALLAGYSDRDRIDWPAAADARFGQIPDEMRAGCGPTDRTFGDMLSLIRFPYKLIWFERYPNELYDLSWDPFEHSNLASVEKDVLRRLEEEAERIAAESGLLSPRSGDAPALDPEAASALRALGYVK